MKKRIMSMLCVVSMLMSLCSVNALAVTNTGEMEMTQPTQFLQMEQPDFLSFADAEPMAEQNAGVQTANITDTVTIIPEVFTDFLTEEGMAKYVLFTLDVGQSVQLTLNCPNDANIDYDLALYTVDDAGNTTFAAGSALTTYINGSSGTVAESCGYINSSTAQ